jgi:hypothetical protein
MKLATTTNSYTDNLRKGLSIFNVIRFAVRTILLNNFCPRSRSALLKAYNCAGFDDASFKVKLLQLKQVCSLNRPAGFEIL